MNGFVPAARARRVRLYKAMAATLAVLICIGVTIVLDKIGILANRKAQLFYAVSWFLLFIGFTIAMAKWKNTFCPRCGWDINFKKPMPAMALFVPSSCPNCGLNLEERIPITTQRNA